MGPNGKGSWEGAARRGLARGMLLALLAASTGWALPAAPTHYAVTGKTPVSMTLTGLLAVEGASAGAGAEVGVYDPQNVLCGVSGVDVANGGTFILHVYGDDPTTPADEGLSAGEALRFEVWNPSGSTVVGHASLRFSAAAFGTAPPAYPPAFGDRAAYSLNLSTNRAPALTAIGSKTVAENSSLGFTVAATDPDGDALTYSAAPLPTGASFNATTRAFGWTPGYTQAGSYTVTFTASDGSLTASEAVTITVTNTNRAPTLTTIGPKTVGESATLSFTVSASDPDGDALTYATTGVLPSGAVFNGATRVFSWTPDYTQAGSYTVTFTATDGAATAKEAVTITVTDVNRPPVLSPIGNRAVNENQLLTFTLSAADPEGQTLAFSTSVLPAGAAFDPVSSTFAWTPAFEQVGNYSVTFTVADNGSPPLSDSETVAITVGDVNRPPVLAAVPAKAVTEGALLAFTVSATDPDPTDALTYGAEALPAGATFDPATRTFSWSPKYGQEGTYAVTFTATDNGAPSLSDTETVSITVAAAVVTVSIPLSAGWNLVSFPVAVCAYTGANPPAVALPPGTSCLPVNSVGDFFSGIAGQYERIESFDAGGAHTYDPGLPGYLSDLTYVAGGYGYRIKMKQASVLTVTGRRLPPSAPLALSAGWTLAGYWGPDVRYVDSPPTVPFPSAVTFSPVGAITDVFPSLGANLKALWSTDALGDHYYPPGSQNPVRYVGLGYGYWVKVSAPGALSFDLP